MKVLLFQLDGRLPNLALLRLAGHHRTQGDDVELRHVRRPEAVERGLWDRFDCVYASLIFQKTRPVAERLLEVYPEAIVGGTGWNLTTTLSDHGVSEDTPPDYSDYPAFRSSLGFSQRGCRLSCEFCVVPRKEGSVREASTIWNLWRGEPFPREILLLDNDFFGQASWPQRITEMREGKFKVSFNQGINCRMISEAAAEAIASVDYRADDMKVRRLYTAWDSKEDESVLFRGLNRLVRAGVNPDNIMVYMLIGFWAGETEEDWLYRQQRLKDFGCRPYPMPFVRNSLTVGFQRYVVGSYHKRISWADWKRNNCRPEKLLERMMTHLPLIDTINEPEQDICPS